MFSGVKMLKVFDGQKGLKTKFLKIPFIYIVFYSVAICRPERYYKSYSLETSSNSGFLWTAG